MHLIQPKTPQCIALQEYFILTKLIVATGPHSRNTRCFENRTFETWEEFAAFIGEPKLGEKEGACFLQGSLKSSKPKQIANGKTSFSNRYLENVEAMSVMAFDVDSGQDPKPIIEALKQRGLAFVAYSSHSDKPDHRKARFVIRLQTSIEIGENLKQDKLTWKRLYVGIAHELGIDIDKACLDLTRLFFTARFSEGVDPDNRLFEWTDGDGLDLKPFIKEANDGDFDRHLPKPPPADKLHQHRERSYDDKVFIDGIDLVRWVGLTEGTFRLNEVACCNDIGDVLFEDEEKSEVVCPFDDDHESCAGERTSGFFVSNPDEEHLSFGAHCCHASCAERDRLDFLRGLIDRGDVLIDDLKDPQFYEDGDEWDAEKKAKIVDCLDGYAPLPSGFSYDPETQQVLKKKPQEEKKGPYSVCGMLKAIATVHDENDKGYGTLVVIRTRSGQEKEVVLKASPKIGDPTATNQLRDEGLQVFGSKGAEQSFKELLAALNPNREIINATRPSFHDDAKIFISPLGTVIRADDYNQSEWILDDDIRLKSEPKGSLQDWRDKIAIPSFSDPKYLPHLGVGVLSGFVGPLIYLLNMDTCIINLSGPTSRGKTSALKLQASVWGPTSGKESLRFEAKSTTNAAESLIERGNGVSVGLDELAHMDRVADLIFTIAGGQGKHRMKSSTALQRTKYWKTFVLMSGEKTIRAYVETAGEQFIGGLAARCADVSVADLASHPEPAFIDQILADAEKYNGVAGPAFVKHLMRHEDIAAIKNRINELKLELSSGDATGAEQRAIIPIALLAVVGEILKRADVLPGEIDHMSSVKWACNQAKASSAIEALDTKEESIKALYEFISTNKGGRIVMISGNSVIGSIPPQGTLGWYDIDNGLVYILYSGFEAICTTASSAVANELLDQELIEPRSKGKDRNATYHDWLPAGLGKAKHIRVKMPLEVDNAYTRAARKWFQENPRPSHSLH